MKIETRSRVRIEERPSPEVESRYAVSPISGVEYVKARRGQRQVTSEEVYELLKDFP
jgi:hypothetical protein